jgi:hypothetical protein
MTIGILENEALTYLSAIVVLCRPHQWTKNAFVLALVIPAAY